MRLPHFRPSFRRSAETAAFSVSLLEELAIGLAYPPVIVHDENALPLAQAGHHLESGRGAKNTMRSC